MSKIENNIRLISLHIPKTAGTSFRNILFDNIGKKNFAKVDIYKSGRLLLNDKLFTGKKFTKKVNAIHGHFSYAALNQYFNLSDEVVYFTWLRNPVERVLSNYFFLKSVLAARLQEKEDENLLNRMGKTLKEFVQMEANQNVMSKFLEDAPLERFSFIGIQDDFENELNRLAQITGWDTLKNRRDNVTKSQENRLKIDSETIELIKATNQKDVALFEKVMNLNKQNTKFFTAYKK